MIDNLFSGEHNDITQEYLKQFNDLIAHGKMTASQLEDIFNSLQLEPVYSDVNFTQVPIMATQQTQEVHRTYLDDSGLNWIDKTTTTTEQVPTGTYENVPGVVAFKKMNIATILPHKMMIAIYWKMIDELKFI